MGLPTSDEIHPTQKRSSCERCRKHKLRCLRSDPGASSCNRCARLAIECVAGQQKRIGRPTRETRNRGEQQSTIRAEATQPQKPTVPHHSTSTPSTIHQPADWAWKGAFATPDAASLQGSAMPSWSMMLGGMDMSTVPPEGTGMDLDSFSWDAFEQSMLELPALTHSDQSDDSTPSFYDSTSPPQQCVSRITDRWVVLPKPPPLSSIQSITPHAAMEKLTAINMKLYQHSEALHQYPGMVVFCSLLDLGSPLTSNGLTMLESTLHISDEFIHIIGGLRSYYLDKMLPPPPIARHASMPSTSTPHGLYLAESTPEDWMASIESSILQAQRMRPGASTSGEHQQQQQGGHLHRPPPALLATPLALCVVSVYTQIMDLLEISLHLFIKRIQCLDTVPPNPIEKLKFGNIELTDMFTQGIVFCQIVVSMLDLIQVCLDGDASVAGSSPDGARGLLTENQRRAMLQEMEASAQKYVDEEYEPLPGQKGVEKASRPARVRRGYDTLRHMVVEASLG